MFKKKYRINKLFIIGIMTIIITVALCGCLETKESSNKLTTDEEKLIGTWTNIDEFQLNPRTISYSFYSNKTCMFSISYEDDFYSENGTWRIENNKLLITIGGEEISGDYEFINDGKTLALIDEQGNAMDFDKE
jgi:hypothetical protein